MLEVFHQTPQWAVDAQTASRDGCDSSPVSMPRDLRDASNFTAWLTQRFDGSVGAYEPWNEGNADGFGGQTTDQRASYQKAAFLGFKGHHASSTTGEVEITAPWVCNNVLAGAGDNTTTEITEKNGLFPYMQSYNIHTYDPVADYESEFAAARRLVRRSPSTYSHQNIIEDNNIVPLWLTECGIHLPASTPSPWSDMTPADDLRQAAFIAPSFAAAQFAGVEKHFFFVLSNYLENGLQYGLIRHDRSPRPGYSALAAVGYFFVGSTSIGRMRDLLTTSPAVAYAMAARPGGGEAKDVVVLYCPVSGQQAQASSCATTPALLSANVQAAASVYDMLGRQLLKPTPVPTNVSVTAPVFVVLPSGFVSTYALHLISLSFLPLRFQRMLSMEREAGRARERERAHDRDSYCSH